MAIACRIDSMNWLVLRVLGNRRARFNWDETGLNAKWLIPCTGLGFPDMRPILEVVTSFCESPNALFNYIRRYIKPARNRSAETILTPFVKLSTPSLLTT